MKSRTSVKLVRPSDCQLPVRRPDRNCSHENCRGDQICRNMHTSKTPGGPRPYIKGARASGLVVNVMVL